MEGRVYIFITENHLDHRTSTLVDYLVDNEINFSKISLNLGRNLTFKERIKYGTSYFIELQSIINELSISSDDILIFTSYEGYEFANLRLWFKAAINHPLKLVLQHGTFSSSERVSLLSLFIRWCVNQVLYYRFGFYLFGYGYNRIKTTYYIAIQEEVAQEIARIDGVKASWYAPNLLIPSENRDEIKDVVEKLCLLVLQDFYISGLTSFDKYEEIVTSILKKVENQGYSIIIKPHPKSPDYEFLNNVKTIKGEFKSVLNELRPEWVISFYSSSLLEAELLGFKCVAVFFPGLKKDFFWYKNTIKVEELEFNHLEKRLDQKTIENYVPHKISWNEVYENIIS